MSSAVTLILKGFDPPTILSHKLESILVVQYSLQSLTFALLKLLFWRIFLALDVFDMTAGDTTTLRHKVNKISF